MNLALASAWVVLAAYILHLIRTRTSLVKKHRNMNE
ncbi:hypothetical protein [Methanolobus chelungpuianus]|nr:hypothetical protein [Methanolobus chelungpuianus]